MKLEVVFLSGSLQLSGSTTWMNTLIKGFEENNIPCLHLITGIEGTIKSSAKDVLYTGRARQSWLLRCMRWFQLHKVFKSFYNKQEDKFFTRKTNQLISNKLADKVLVIKDFTSYLPACFEEDRFFVVAVLHQQYKRFEQGYYYDLLCSVSETVQRESYEIGFNVQNVIYNPLDIDSIKSRSLEYQVREDSFLLFVGKLHKEKGIFELLEAYRDLVKDGYAQLNLIYIGEGRDKEQLLNRIAEYGLKDKVKLTGFLLNPYPYISKAKILLLPSYSEAMPYVVIEAAVLNTAYLVSDFTSAREFFQEENIFPMKNFRPDILEMKQKVVQLLNEPSYELKEGLVEKIKPNTVVSTYYNLLKNQE